MGVNGPADPLIVAFGRLQQIAAQVEDGPDPNNAFEVEITPGDLGQAVRDSWDRLQSARDVRTRCLELYTGRHYGENVDSGLEEYVNLMQQAVESYLPQLVSFEPKAHVDAIDGGLTVEAMVRELSLNRVAKKCDLAEVHFNVVLEAIFAPWGIIRTGLKAGNEQVSVGDKTFIRGEFFVENIDFEDFVTDQSGRRPNERLFDGHRIRIPRAVALAAEKSPGVPLYDAETIRNAPRLQLGKELPSDADRIAGFSGDPYDLVDMIELWEIAVYYGDRTMIYTLSNLDGGEWAREPYQYWGPADGPYIKLWFTGVPSNNVPVTYAQRMLDLHDAGIRTAYRFIEAIDRTKVAHIYRPGEEDLADALRNADDNEWIKGDPTAINSTKTGGVVPELQPGMQFIMELFNNAGGSPQLVGGSKDIAKTATAATILQGNAQQRVAVMNYRSMRVLSTVFEHAAWYQDNDPMLHETLVSRLPGGVRVEFENTAELREGDFSKFVFTVDAYSARPMDPAVRLDKLTNGLGILFQAATLGPQGFSKVAQILAKELQLPEIDEINLDPVANMARQAVVAAEGGPPKNNPLKAPQRERPEAPYQQSLNQSRGTVSKANGPAARAA